jgi:glycosyltransferase involved in cell wall biosynthesis
VSVIVPTYNRRGYLEGTLRSIFEQTIDVHEVILVDDGSDDGTPALVDEFVQRHGEWAHRLTYTWQPNAGKSAALNVGLRRATGDWIAFNDSDDRWLPRKLEMQFAALRAYPLARACFTDVRFVNNPALTETALAPLLGSHPSRFGLWELPARRYARSWPGIYMQTMVIASETMREFGEFDETLRMSMDTDFGFRLGLITPMCFVNAPLVEVDRIEPRTVGLMTEYPINCLERMQTHERMITKWLSLTRAGSLGGGEN